MSPNEDDKEELEALLNDDDPAVREHMEDCRKTARVLAAITELLKVPDADKWNWLMRCWHIDHPTETSSVEK